MKTISQNIINNHIEYILQEKQLLSFFNKKELNMLFFDILKNNGRNIRYVEKPTKKMQLIAVKESGYAIQFIDNPTKEIRLKAIKTDGCAIKYIKEPTEEMQLLALKTKK